MRTSGTTSATTGRTGGAQPVTIGSLKKNGAKFYDFTPEHLACVTRDLAVCKGKLYQVTTGMPPTQPHVALVERDEAAEALKSLRDIAKGKETLRPCPKPSEQTLKHCDRYDLMPGITCASFVCFVNRKSNEVYFESSSMAGAKWATVAPEA